VGAREQTVRGRGGGERHGVDEIGCEELRREPQERARAGGCPPDMGGDGQGSESGGGRAERVGRDEGGGSNDGKTSAEYARGLRESRSVGEAVEILVGFRMRNGFRERLVTGLKERGYHGKQAGGRGYRGERPGGEMSRPQDVRKRVAWEGLDCEQRYEDAGRWGKSIRGVAAPGGVKCVRRQKGPRPMRPDGQESVRTHWTRPFHIWTE